MEHEVRAVADHDDGLPIVSGGVDRAPDAEAAGDLVAHARERVFDVVAERITRAPELLQITGQGAGGLNDDVARACGSVDRTDDLGLTRQCCIGGCCGRVDDGRPVRALTVDLRTQLRAHPELAEAVVQSADPLPRVGDEGEAAAVLERVERGDVEIDEADARPGTPCGWPS